MLRQVVRTIQKYNMFEPGERVLVAVSGGPDSMALLSALRELNARFCLNIFVAHLDHHVRKGSSKDLDFVQKACDRLDLPLIAKTLDWRRTKREGSLEEQLRLRRYEFLLQAAGKIRAKKIVLGHTQDDQAETVLMRLLRGSGLYGLSAILPKRSREGFCLVRPLIEVSRKDVLGFLAGRKIAYRTDKTNFEDRFLRNRVRNTLLPFLEKNYNVNIKEGLANIALSVGADYEFLSKQAALLLDKHLKKKGRVLVFPLQVFMHMDIALRRLVLRRMIELSKGDLKRLSFAHVQDMEELVFSRPRGSQLHLPLGVVVLKTGKAIEFIKR